MLTVFNVGQGDSFLYEPNCGCDFDDPDAPLLIDTGPPVAQVVRRINASGATVLVTHSHEDHLGGLPAILKGKKTRCLYMPWYLPEVITIYRYVQAHCSIAIGGLNWSVLTNVETKLVCEGDKLCGHIKVFNPPKNPWEAFYKCDSHEKDNEGSIQSALGNLSKAGLDLPTEEIINYETPLHKENSRSLSSAYRLNAKTFVHKFFISLSDRISQKKQYALSYYIDAHMELAANQTSVVFKFNHPNTGKWLFTGDADELVFERLLSSGTDLTAKYLKIPHHGSRGNITRRILTAISPEVAIISHGNRRFGRSLDAHPHHEVIDMLDQKGIRCYYTNEVIKDGIAIKPGTTGSVEDGDMAFF
ncbi:MAG: MBL fold metallo-hydrolase [Acidobacteriota bacterium]|nr:MBL fold metallo-hydrolase [Acidobacteriota bacterium]